MPLVNPRFDRRSNEVKTLKNNIFHSFTSNSSLSKNFDKFDQKSIMGGPKNPNFDLTVRMGWNQCLYEDIKFSFQQLLMGKNWS